MVRPLKAAVVAGIAVALLVGAMFVIRPVPDRVVSLFGGATGLERAGGVRVWYRPPATAGALDRTGAAIRRCRDGEPPPCASGVLVLEYFGMDQDELANLADVLVGGGLSMHEVLETSFFGQVAPYATAGVELDIDRWSTEDGERRDAAFLDGPTRQDLEDTLARAAAAGVKPPPGSEVMFEATARSWRTYLLASDVLIDGLDVRSARTGYDPNTNRPIVLVDLTGGACEEGPRLRVPRSAGIALRSDLFEHSTGLLPSECARTADTTDGATKFCAATRRLVGHKLAIVFGGRLRSAPLIEGPICGGTLSITMGADDRQDPEREASVLAGVLDRGAVPRGGSIEDARWLPRADVRMQEWLGRALIGLVVGLGFGLACWLVVRMARPSRQERAPRPSGEFPFGRLFVTLLGPIALLIGQQITLPAVNDVELDHVSGTSVTGSVIGLGVMPILFAFVLVEVVALAVPRLRWRRHDAKGRIRLRQAVAVLALGFVLLKGYFLARTLEHASMYGAEVVAIPGKRFELFTMVTLAAGTMLLAVLAGIISVHGLTNGYAVLLVSDWLLDVARPLLAEEDHAFPAYFDRTRLFGIATLAVMMLLAWCAMRWRIRGAERELELRVPSSSISPVADATGMPALVAALATLGVTGVTWLDAIRGSMLLSAAFVIVFGIGWSWLFARPALLARPAMQAGFAPPSRLTWWRATLASAGLLVALALLGLLALGTDYWNNYARNLPYTSYHLHASSIADPAMALIASAVLLDMVAAVRAHRERLVPVAELHQIQRAAIVERVLAAANIRFHIHAANVRTLFAFLGPWAPAVVMVPESAAREADERLDGALREPRGTLPAARLEPPRTTA